MLHWPVMFDEMQYVAFEKSWHGCGTVVHLLSACGGPTAAFAWMLRVRKPMVRSSCTRELAAGWPLAAYTSAIAVTE